MKRAAALLYLLLLSCRSTYVPEAAQVHELERRLGANACIGDVRRWARTYWIDPEHPQLVQFSFGKPTDKWMKGITLVTTHRWQKLVHYNDAPFAALGQYDINTGEVTLKFCGPSAKGASSHDSRAR